MTTNDSQLNQKIFRARKLNSMNINRPKTLVGALLVAVISVGSPIVYADSLEAIMQVGKERTKDSRASQNKVDRVSR